MTNLKTPSKYRRAFDWRITHGQEEGLSKSTASAMVRLSSSDFPDILEDFLAISRKRQQNPTAIERLQIHMLEELLIHENAAKHYRQRLKEIESSTQSVETDRRVKDIEFCKGEQFFHRMYANAIRSIGDGIAWRALGYDRAVTRVLGEGATKQHVSSEGTVQELREWSHHFETGTGIAILNSLTNCLAIGDVTLVRNDGSVEIIEVKSSKTKSSRKIRQKHAMSEVVTLLSTGQGQREEREIRIEMLPIAPENSLNKVLELLETAGDKGWAARRLNDWLYVEAFDFRAMNSEDDVRDLTEKFRKDALREWEQKDDFIFDLNSLNAIAYSPNCAPFSIFPFRASTCVELLIGAKFYVTFLNLTAVEREFVKRGWRLEKDFKTLADGGQEGLKESMLNVTKGPFHANIPPAEFMRMQIETLRPKTLIDALEWQFRQGPGADQEYVLAIYEAEARVWN